jgi:hypothetical protein
MGVAGITRTVIVAVLCVLQLSNTFTGRREPQRRHPVVLAARRSVLEAAQRAAAPWKADGRDDRVSRR